MKTLNLESFLINGMHNLCDLVLVEKIAIEELAATLSGVTQIGCYGTARL